MLKGSAEVGRRVLVSSCGPRMTGPTAKAFAKELIGTRGLFLLAVNHDGTSSQYSEITTPQNMTLDEEIARARDVLGLGPALTGGVSWRVWVIAGVGVAALAVVEILTIRRSRHG